MSSYLYIKSCFNVLYIYAIISGKNENYCKVLIYYLNSEDKNIFCNAQIRWFSKQSVIYPFTKVNHRTDICHSAITERSRNVVKWQNYAIQLPSS